MQNILENKLEKIREICYSLEVKRLYAFGSVVSDSFREDSDIDFLLSFSDSLSVKQYTDNYFTLHYRLQDLFNRKIDIVTERSLSNPYLIETIDETKKLIYETPI